MAPHEDKRNKAARNTLERKSKWGINVYTTQKGVVGGRGKSEDVEAIIVIEVMA